STCTCGACAPSWEATKTWCAQCAASATASTGTRMSRCGTPARRRPTCSKRRLDERSAHPFDELRERALRLELLHVRVAVVGRSVERLLDRPRAGPAHHVRHRAGLVVGSGCPAAAERLLADYRTGGAVVDVEVAGRSAQAAHHVVNDLAVAGEDRTGEGVRRRLVDHGEQGVEVGVILVYVHRDERAEVLGGEQLVFRVGALDDRRADEVAL